MGTTPSTPTSTEKSDIVYLCVNNFMILNRYLGNDYPTEILFIINTMYHELYGIHKIVVSSFGVSLAYYSGNSVIGTSRISFK